MVDIEDETNGFIKNCNFRFFSAKIEVNLKQQ